MFISGDKKADDAAKKTADDKKTADAKAVKVYDGPDRRVSATADRRAIPAAKWPVEKFPAWKYHATEGRKIFASQDEVDAAGAGWADAPADVKK